MKAPAPTRIATLAVVAMRLFDEARLGRDGGERRIVDTRLPRP